MVHNVPLPGVSSPQEGHFHLWDSCIVVSAWANNGCVGKDSQNMSKRVSNVHSEGDFKDLHSLHAGIGSPHKSFPRPTVSQSSIPLVPLCSSGVPVPSQLVASKFQLACEASRKCSESGSSTDARQLVFPRPETYVVRLIRHHFH